MARDFDGANDRVGDFVIGTGIDSTTSSWSFWVQTDTDPASTFNIWNELTSGAAFRQNVVLRNPGTPGAGFTVRFSQDTNGTDGVWTSTTDIAHNAWHHVAVTYDRSALTNDPIIYVDNSVQGLTETTPTMTVQTGEDRVRIGEDAAGAGDLNGMVAELACWNVILTAAEVTALYRGVNPYRVRSLSLKAYIPMHGIQSPEIEHVVGTTGTVTGTTQVTHVPKAMPWGWMFDGWRGQQAAAAAGWAHLLGDSRNRLIYAGGGD